MPVSGVEFRRTTGTVPIEAKQSEKPKQVDPGKQ
jgi:hypothetical protein